MLILMFGSGKREVRCVVKLSFFPPFPQESAVFVVWPVNTADFAKRSKSLLCQSKVLQFLAIQSILVYSVWSSETEAHTTDSTTAQNDATQSLSALSAATLTSSST